MGRTWRGAGQLQGHARSVLQPRGRGHQTRQVSEATNRSIRSCRPSSHLINSRVGVGK